MKNLLIVLLILTAIPVLATKNAGKLEIGDKAVLTDVKMTDVSGKSVSIADVKKENGVLVLFSCNTCPFVLKWESRYNEIKKWADNNNVGMIVLNSNYQNRTGSDSMEAMQEKAKKQGYNFHYVVDKESRIANSFGGQTTPHVFLFDSNYDLAYKGAIDDGNGSAEKVSKEYLQEALVSLGSGKAVAINETKPVGCSIKRKLD
ncbi:thioredoxin family protein [Maribellus sediminis]|uniref:thioredoxin family protein n=1 Tax=Maribellus sediminis TaxID=2696285 RepID=UPI00142F3D30|nr:thioredoxin family protein [Maribellus sediminis]